MVTCRYKYCKHDSKKLEKEDAVKDGNAYYHQDCYEEKQNKNELFKMMNSYMTTTSPAARVWKAINTLIHEKDIDSGLLKFALSEYIKTKKPLRYPEGIYYVITDEVVKEDNRMKCPRYEFGVVGEVGHTFNYQKPYQRSFENLMK